MSNLPKYPTPSCAQCGSTIKGKGWFCSPRCDEFEMTQRRGDGKERFEQGKPVRRAVSS